MSDMMCLWGEHQKLALKHSNYSVYQMVVCWWCTCLGSSCYVFILSFRCRLRRCSWKNPTTIFADSKVYEEDIQVGPNWEIFLEVLEGKMTLKDMLILLANDHWQFVSNNTCIHCKGQTLVSCVIILSKSTYPLNWLMIHVLRKIIIITTSVSVPWLTKTLMHHWMLYFTVFYYLFLSISGG